jgi:hypothetical protein
MAERKKRRKKTTDYKGRVTTPEWKENEYYYSPGTMSKFRKTITTPNKSKIKTVRKVAQPELKYEVNSGHQNSPEPTLYSHQPNSKKVSKIKENKRKIVVKNKLSTRSNMYERFRTKSVSKTVTNKKTGKTKYPLIGNTTVDWTTDY